MGRQLSHGVIRTTCYPVLPFEQVVMDALAYLWHPSYNCFVLPWGFQTITMEDVALIIGLSPTGTILSTGESIPSARALSVATETWLKHHGKNKGANIAYTALVKHYISCNDMVTSFEEVLFLNFIFSELFMNAGCVVNKTFLN